MESLRQQLAGVITDGSRIDRFLTWGPDGLYLTTENLRERQFKVLWLDSGEPSEEDIDGILEEATRHLDPDAQP